MPWFALKHLSENNETPSYPHRPIGVIRSTVRLVNYLLMSHSLKFSNSERRVQECNQLIGLHQLFGVIIETLPESDRTLSWSENLIDYDWVSMWIWLTGPIGLLMSPVRLQFDQFFIVLGVWLDSEGYLNARFWWTPIDMDRSGWFRTRTSISSSESRMHSKSLVFNRRLIELRSGKNRQSWVGHTSNGTQQTPTGLPRLSEGARPIFPHS